MNQPEDPWVEITDDFGRTRLVRKSVAESIKKPEEPSKGMMSEDMKREEERLKWEEEMKAEADCRPFSILNNY